MIKNAEKQLVAIFIKRQKCHHDTRTSAFAFVEDVCGRYCLLYFFRKEVDFYGFIFAMILTNEFIRSGSCF